MRFRVREEYLGSYTITGTRDHGGGWVEQWQDTVPGVQSLKSIEMFRDPWPSPRRWKSRYTINRAAHINIKNLSLAREYDFWQYGNHTTYTGTCVSYDIKNATLTAFEIVPFATGAHGNFDLDDTASLFPTLYTNLFNSASESWEQMPSEMSLANDLLELKDIARLRDTALSLASLLQSRSHLWRRSSDGTVNSFLAYNFGVKPLVQSVQGIRNALFSVHKRLEFLKKSYGKTVTLSQSASTSVSPVPWEGYPDFIHRYGGTYKFTLGAHLSHRLLHLDDVSALLNGLASYAGFNKPLVIAWNAIPYSFLVDWLYDVSTLLGRFQIPTFEGQYELHDKWHSCRFKGTCTFEHWPVKWADARNHAHTLASWDVDLYARFPGIPSPVGEASPLTWLQQMLIGALTYQSGTSFFRK